MAARAKSPMFGFTLIELMVTLTVLAVLVGLAMPSFSNFLDKYRLRGAVDDVISVVASARTEAVKTGLDVRVDFAGTASAWCVGANPATVPSGGVAAAAPADCDCTSGPPGATPVTGECNYLPDGRWLGIEIGKHEGVTASAGTLTQAFVFDSKLGTINPLGTSTARLTSPKGKYHMQINVNALGQTSACVLSTDPIIVGVPTCP